MKLNTKNPTFIHFIDNVTSNILNNISVENYFKYSIEKKSSMHALVYKMTKSLLNSNIDLKDDEIKDFLIILWKKNEEKENYELSAILKEITNNFESINDLTKPIKKQTKTNKINK